MSKELLKISRSIKERIIPVFPVGNENISKIELKYNEQFNKRKGTLADPLIYITKLVNSAQTYDITTSLYFIYSKHFPLRENVLICNPKTTKSDIQNFFRIYRFYNTSNEISNFKLENINSNENQQDEYFPKFLFTVLFSDDLNKANSNVLIKTIHRKLTIQQNIHFFYCVPVIHLKSTICSRLFNKEK
ncbi:hypothetical protein M0811_08179 [Anaeramoeba ignava]|uniref:Uncharacterized protein n=1 Tax=Anaeramoeba ignava TaxID=1746090 RepID=A0A9Q0LJQ3_ANAIG|nr:hypothetical protein M0811_08179 [Anaeramoeba ignava]